MLQLVPPRAAPALGPSGPISGCPEMSAIVRTKKDVTPPAAPTVNRSYRLSHSGRTSLGTAQPSFHPFPAPPRPVRLQRMGNLDRPPRPPRAPPPPAGHGPQARCLPP